MDYKYDAFISYRHAEKDTLIASEVQKTLEHFQIPKALRKSSGKERFNRVFRDVEELPLANNLTEELEQALKDSQYLIVICSYSTSESDWVKREIDTFLEFHDYDKQLVLTVLVEGEPGEVIPEVLRHDNITHYLADGTFYCKDELVEPLSADYRQPIKKARKTELPRLAAAMLGCKYDEIIRRRKAYQRRRLLIETTIISVIAVGILVYIGQLYVKLQESLYKAQVSQSVYLAAESQRLLEAGDRSGAIQLALAALENSDGSKRPHTDEAEFALSQALGSYVTAGATSSVPLWRYETESHIVSYDISNSGEYIVALDFRRVIHIWNTNDHKETIYNDKTNYSVSDIRFDKDDNLIVCGSSGICVIDVKTMEEKWKYKLYCPGDTETKYFTYYQNKEYIVLNCKDSLCILNATNGQLIKSFEIGPRVVNSFKCDSFTICNYAFTSDFSRVAITGKTSSSYDAGYDLISYDVKTDKVYKLLENMSGFQSVAFDESGYILVLRHSSNDEDAEKKSKQDITYDAPILFEKYSVSGSRIWSTELSSINRIYIAEIFCSECVLSDGAKKVAIAVFGNRVVIVDAGIGKTIKSYDLLDSIVGLCIYKYDEFQVIIRNGDLLTIKPNEGAEKQIKSGKLVKENSIDFRSCNGKRDNEQRYFVEDTSEKVITEYVNLFLDSSYEGIEGTESFKSAAFLQKNEDFMLGYHEVYLDNGEREVYLMGVDIKERKVLWSKKLPELNYVFTSAFSPDNNYAYTFQGSKHDDDWEYSLIKIDVKTGEFKEANSSFRVKNISSKTYVVQGGLIWVREFNFMDYSLSIYCYDTTNDSYKEFKVDTKELGEFNPTSDTIASPDGKSLIFQGHAYKDDKTNYFRIVFDCKTGKFKSYKCEKPISTSLSDDGKYIAEQSSEDIKIYSLDGREQCKIDMELRRANVMGFNNGRLYVLYDTADLCCYDLKGRKIAELSLGNDPQSITTSELEFAQGMLFVTSGNNSGNNTDVIDISTNKRLCSFNGLLCIHNTGKERSDLELVVRCFATGCGQYMGCIKFKTPDTLIKQAKEYLTENGVKMSDEFKRKYGIE